MLRLGRKNTSWIEMFSVSPSSGLFYELTRLMNSSAYLMCVCIDVTHLNQYIYVLFECNQIVSTDADVSRQLCTQRVMQHRFQIRHINTCPI